MQALKKLNRLLSNYTNGGAADIDRIIASFAAVKGKTVVQKIKAIKADWKYKDIDGKSHEEFRGLVHDAEDLFTITGSKTLKSDLSTLRGFLANGDPVSTDEFVAYLTLSPPARQSPQRSRQANPLDATKFSDDLVRSLENKKNFEDLVSMLTAPRAFSMAQINEVALHFLGYKTAFKTKTAAASALKRRQADMTIGGAQIHHIEGLRV